MKTYLVTKSIVPVVCLTLLFLSMIAPVSPATAQEMRSFIPSYEGEELSKVREWEKEWAGKKVDQSNARIYSSPHNIK